jgi:hypothetical protein
VFEHYVPIVGHVLPQEDSVGLFGQPEHCLIQQLVFGGCLWIKQK